MRSRETLLRLHRFRTEEKRRQVADIDFMIQDFMRKYEELDGQMKFEESRNGVTDPAHFNYSLSAKAARSRRDNSVTVRIAYDDVPVAFSASVMAERSCLDRPSPVRCG